MEINAKVLKGFFEKITAGCIIDVVCNFNDNGLEVAALSADNIVMVKGSIPKTVFKNYESIGEIGLQNIFELSKVVDKFDGDVSIVVEGNILILKSGSKKVEVELAAIETISKTSFPDLSAKFTETFSIDSKLIYQFINDSKIGGDTDIIFVTEPQKLILKSNGKYKFEQVIEVPNIIGDVVSRYGAPFFPAFEKLDSNVTISCAKNFPILVTEKTESSVVQIIVAPIVEQTPINKEKEPVEETKAEESA